MRYILVITFLVALIACEKNDKDNTNGSGFLIGSWIFAESNDSVTTYQKIDELPTDYGFTFKQDNKFVERKNSGWCGTPPISYKDFDGTWTRNDSIISISVGYWGGTENYIWKIISLDQFHLQILVISRETVPD